MTRGREVALKENRRLQADLNTMTMEHQVCEGPFIPSSGQVINHVVSF